MLTNLMRTELPINNSLPAHSPIVDTKRIIYQK